MNKKTGAVYLTFLIALLTLVGCGGGNQQSPASEESESDQTAIKVWVMGSDEYWRTYHDELVDRFTKDNPMIQVELEYIPWNEGEKKLITAAANESLPDVSTIAGRWTAQMAEMDVLEPLNNFYKDDYPEQFVKAAWDTTQYKGKTWGLPVGFTTTGLFYRSDWLEQAGFEQAPATWEEFVEVSKSFTKDGHYGFGLVGYNGMETTMFWAPFLWSNGGEFLTSDLKQAAFNEPEAVEALQFYVDLYREHKVAPEGSINNQRQDSQDLFLTGSVGMTTVGPWFPKFLEKDAPNLAFGIAPYPVKKKAANLGTADHIVMFNTSNKKEAAWKFIDFFTNEENDKKWAKYQGFIPYRKANIENNEMANDPNFQLFFDVAKDSVSYPVLPEWPQIDQAVAEAIQKALMGEKTPKQALDEAAETVNALLNQ
ncbi:hypothetical protein BEP19_03255 [Ammoniphilus oxalaticus]|uniref:ABC transporter substrate-binding protein n=1 Tax=Ammoniphilus oxalaticus TaxID=66863 RepID=A0A419SNT5_9BACL|nr:ABC transporter substrate-binding protein [Ammoniphilus oxalaticus]RKD25956.1 hypothetical protein BEP19_03255 [Ammoniphilus oxalaticus]